MGSASTATILSSRSLLLLVLAVTTTTTTRTSLFHHTQRAAAWQFAYYCNEYFFLADSQIQCAADLLDTLAASPADGGQYSYNDCYGNPLYGYRWVDRTQSTADQCLEAVKYGIKDEANTNCSHKAGVDFVDAATPSVCRMKFEVYPFTL